MNQTVRMKEVNGGESIEEEGKGAGGLGEHRPFKVSRGDQEEFRKEWYSRSSFQGGGIPTSHAEGDDDQWRSGWVEAIPEWAERGEKERETMHCAGEPSPEILIFLFLL